MRRSLILSLLLLLLSVTVAGAQLNLNTYPGNVMTLFPTAVTVGNTATATALFSTTVPAVLTEQFAQPQFGAFALHLKALGTVSTAAGGGSSFSGVNVGCNYGGSTASIALVNGVLLTQNLSSAPLFLDLWLRTSNTAAPILTGRLDVIGASVTATNGSPAMNAATTTGTTSVTAPQTLTCIWQWASAASTNTVTINHAVLVVGE